MLSPCFTERDRPSGSFSSFGPIKKKSEEIKCWSQPFLKPDFGLDKVRYSLKLPGCFEERLSDFCVTVEHSGGTP